MSSSNDVAEERWIEEYPIEEEVVVEKKVVTTTVVVEERPNDMYREFTYENDQKNHGY